MTERDPEAATLSFRFPPAALARPGLRQCVAPTRSGRRCRNLGRHPLPRGWACTTHYKLLTDEGRKP